MSSNKRSKRNTRNAASDSLSSDQLTEFVFSGPNMSATRLYTWIETQFEKQNQFISERSSFIESMINETKSTIFTEIESKFNDFKNEVLKNVRIEIDELNKKVKELDSVNSQLMQLKSDVKLLNTKILQQENSAIASDLRITGIPYTDTEDLNNIFDNICQALNTNTPHVKSIFRVKHFKNIRNVADPPIIVKLRSPFEKNRLIKTLAAFRRKNKSPLRLIHAGLQSDVPFYVNENLTPHNYDIFKAALRLKKDKVLATAYTVRGIVYVKKLDGDKPFPIEMPD